ncbi:hypothetical protein [Cellulomonas sp. NTE-D12]|uniref:hypothetical protein n=1 Tax=Cellulomonas sp. NTE-D12 TaxID=2962632 RepID=UPI003081CE22|nr:hypothetical protein CELD12_17320 [Cellulomonas sp. NTE-D12]
MTTTGAVAVELYGLPLEQFTAARDAHAKELRREGDRTVAAQVSRLPKPSVAAWAVDLLVRHERDLVEQLVEVGAALREAQETLAGEQLRELDRERRRLLTAIGQQARALAEAQGQHLSDSVLGQVQATVHAAMADPAAAAAVRSGVLTTSLETSGFGPVDVDGAVAVVGAAPLPHTRRAAADTELATAGAGRSEQRQEAAARHREERRGAELSEARADLAEAEQLDRRAAEQAATAHRAVQELDERRAALAERAEALRHELQALQAENDALAARLAGAREALREAANASRSAGRASQRARARVERLEHEGAQARPS